MGQTKSQRRKEAKHVRIYRKQVYTPAWRSLTGSAVKVWVALGMFDNGDNNGDIFFSERTAVQMTGFSRNTVRRALQELEETGFIYCSERGHFDRKTPHAAKYGFTWLPGQPQTPRRAPRHDYEKWSGDENQRDQFLTETGSVSDTNMETSPVPGSISEHEETEKWLVSAKELMSEIEPQTVYQGEDANARHPETRKQGNPDRAMFQASLRLALVQALESAQPGFQRRLAEELSIPGGTLSKFKHGANLADHHAAGLARFLLREVSSQDPHEETALLGSIKEGPGRA